jgi:hypothetical protein
MAYENALPSSERTPEATDRLSSPDGKESLDEGHSFSRAAPVLVQTVFQARMEKSL